MRYEYKREANQRNDDVVADFGEKEETEDMKNAKTEEDGLGDDFETRNVEDNIVGHFGSAQNKKTRITEDFETVGKNKKSEFSETKQEQTLGLNDGIKSTEINDNNRDDFITDEKKDTEMISDGVRDYLETMEENYHLTKNMGQGYEKAGENKANNVVPSDDLVLEGHLEEHRRMPENFAIQEDETNTYGKKSKKRARKKIIINGRLRILF